MSIFLVLMSHSKVSAGVPAGYDPIVRWFPDGAFGVEIFFVISGFLITFLLLREFERTGTISLRAFYARRALRILPAYICYVAVVFLLFRGSRFSPSLAQDIGLLTFTSNYIRAPEPLGHIWSLCVEEQFYLIWPAVFWAILSTRAKTSSGMDRRLFRTFLVVLVIPIVLAPVARVISYRQLGGILFTNYSFLCKCDSIAWGCAMACICAYKGEAISSFIGRYRGRLIGAALLMIGLLIVLTRFFILGVVTVPFTTSVNAIGICILLLVSVSAFDRPSFAWLNWRPLVVLGVGSYSLYLWQELFCDSYVFNFATVPWWLRFPAWVLPAGLAALMSYWAIERPFLSLKGLWGGNGRSRKQETPRSISELSSQ